MVPASLGREGSAMEQPFPIRRYVLVPSTGRIENAAVRRFKLARVAPAPHSALGVDRLARLERVAGMSGADADARDDRSGTEGQAVQLTRGAGHPDPKPQSQGRSAA
jgi:hypothetical protein